MRICRSVFVKMSLNSKLSGSNGSFSMHFNMDNEKGSLYGPRNYGWKWKQFTFACIFFLFIGFVSLAVLDNAKFRREVNFPVFTEQNAQIVLKHFNLSKEQIYSFASLLERDQVSC